MRSFVCPSNEPSANGEAIVYSSTRGVYILIREKIYPRAGVDYFALFNYKSAVPIGSRLSIRANKSEATVKFPKEIGSGWQSTAGRRPLAISYDHSDQRQYIDIHRVPTIVAHIN